jgi:P27 family predicted phage terminase small subunit
MKPGPSRLPTKILELRGSRHRKRPSEPSAAPLQPRVPAWLDSDGKKVWRSLIKRFDNTSILTELDQEALGRYCDMLSSWRKMATWRHEHGEVYPIRDRHGTVTGVATWPQMKLYIRLAEALNKLEQQFGMTPGGRAGLVKEQDKPAHGNSDEAQNKERYFRFG